MVGFCIPDAAVYDKFGNRMIQRRTPPDKGHDAANLNASPEVDSESGVTGSKDHPLPLVFHTPTPDTALERKTATELWNTTALPANDNLKLTAD